MLIASFRMAGWIGNPPKVKYKQPVHEEKDEFKQIRYRIFSPEILTAPFRFFSP